MTGTIIECTGLYAGYPGITVVHDVNLALHRGEIIAVVGPNGAGKTTLLLTLAGLLPLQRGRVRVGDADLPTGRTAPTPTSGVVLVPDDRALFPSLTPQQHLELAAGKRDITEALALFPGLRSVMDVPAGLLSGGEQQMVAIARALVQRPDALLVDELSMGLAPLVTERLLSTVRELADSRGTGIILVEQHVRLAVEVADRVVVLVHGECRADRPAHDFTYEELSRSGFTGYPLESTPSVDHPHSQQT